MLPAHHQDPVRVLLADRPGIARMALRRLIAETPGALVVGEVGEVGEVRHAVKRLRPDVLVVDDRLVGDGLGPRDAALRMIVVGSGDHPGYEARARRLGAEAWVGKERAGELLPALLA